MLRRLVLVSLLALALVSCGGDDDDPSVAADSTTSTTAAAPEDTTTTAVVADDEPLPVDAGISLTATGFLLAEPEGSTTELVFPAPKAAVVDALTAAIGAPTADAPHEEPCPSGDSDSAVRWDEPGLLLLVAGDEVVGWSLRRGATLTTDLGVGVGSTRTDLEAAYGPAEIVPESTLDDVEFFYEDLRLGGLLDADGPDGTITALWAGATCIFR